MWPRRRRRKKKKRWRPIRRPKTDDDLIHSREISKFRQMLLCPFGERFAKTSILFFFCQFLGKCSARTSFPLTASGPPPPLQLSTDWNRLRKVTRSVLLSPNNRTTHGFKYYRTAQLACMCVSIDYVTTCSSPDQHPRRRTMRIYPTRCVISHGVVVIICCYCTTTPSPSSPAPL